MGNFLGTEIPSFEPIEAPIDTEGYITSFTADQKDAITDFFDKYGFVVISGVLSEQETEEGVDTIWKSVEKPNGLNRNDPATWDRFPGATVGILGSIVPKDMFAWQLRQHPKLHEAFAAVLNTDDLMVSLDRYGFMRPTKNIELKGEKVNKPEWKTTSAWFHWDLNPWNHLTQPLRSDEEELDYYKEKGEYLWQNEREAISLFVTENNDRPEAHFKGSHKVQGVVSLLDSREEDGGFICVPGFHKYLESWTAKNKKNTNAPFVQLNYNSPDIAVNAQKIPMRKGSLCAWNSRLPHCNYPNDSDRFRACFYVKMFPRKVLPLHLPGFSAARAQAVMKDFPEGFQPSELGKKVFGLDLVEVE